MYVCVFVILNAEHFLKDIQETANSDHLKVEEDF